ncbi:MAG TPA: hypothetical protein PLY73_15080, partial [Candidatus Ozemobacteraceae bacterium]|nr:hypothetical protein [Candidatus Ozemobacteraceae bacterium]
MPAFAYYTPPRAPREEAVHTTDERHSRDQLADFQPACPIFVIFLTLKPGNDDDRYKVVMAFILLNQNSPVLPDTGSGVRVKMFHRRKVFKMRRSYP